MQAYKSLKRQTFQLGEYAIVPIRYEDRFDIMKWRNEQLYHLRQTKPLTHEDQDNYFENVIGKLFEQDQPNQILFSYIKYGECIGYGGLVHINWIDKNAEISFIIDTDLEKTEFDKHWGAYLRLIEEVAFKELSLHKIFTYAFDLRAHLYEILEKNGYNKEAELIDHCLFNNKFQKVIIHSKIVTKSFLRLATEYDVDMTFKWVSNPEIRKYSLNKEQITYSEHSQWFLDKIASKQCLYFIYVLGTTPIGSVRIDIKEREGIISYLIDTAYQGKGFGKAILCEMETLIKINYPKIEMLSGIVLEQNEVSLNIFKKLGYHFSQTGNRDFLRIEKNIK